MDHAQTAEQITKQAAIITGGGTALFGWGINEWAAAVGATVAILTLIMNFYFARRRFALEKALIEKRLRESDINSPPQ